MAFSDAQNARVQDDIDNHLIKEFLQSDALSLCNQLADSFQKGFPNDPGLLAACNGLRYVGQQMNTGEIEPDPPDAAHLFIEGIYARGGDGYTQFLTAYVDAYRHWDTLNFQGTPYWKLFGDAVQSTFKDVKDAASGVGLGLSDTVKWLVVGVVALLAIVLLVRVGAKS